MKSRSYLKFFYLLFLLAIGFLIERGHSYYFLSYTKKVRHSLHPLFRQSGTLGHGLGVVGTLFMILLLTYSLRKRWRLMRNWGNLNTWLEIHIFLGLTGPVLVLFHTNFRFFGLVAISFWAMMLVVLSGIIGHYIYQLIPHSLSGMELGRIELEAEEIGLTFAIRKLLPPDHAFWNFIHDLEQHHTEVSGLRSFLLFFDALSLRLKLKKVIKKMPEKLDPKSRKNLIRLIVRRQMLIRRMGLLESTRKILHNWHLIHKPFVFIMFLVLIIHVYIAIKMGYRWIL